MHQEKLFYLCPQADVISFGPRENFCQSSETEVNLGSPNIAEDLDFVSIPWEGLL